MMCYPLSEGEGLFVFEHRPKTQGAGPWLIVFYRLDGSADGYRVPLPILTGKVDQLFWYVNVLIVGWGDRFSPSPASCAKNKRS
jgi:hypothetical protein